MFLHNLEVSQPQRRAKLRTYQLSLVACESKSCPRHRMKCRLPKKAGSNFHVEVGSFPNHWPDDMMMRRLPPRLTIENESLA